MHKDRVILSLAAVVFCIIIMNIGSRADRFRDRDSGTNTPQETGAGQNTEAVILSPDTPYASDSGAGEASGSGAAGEGAADGTGAAGQGSATGEQSSGSGAAGKETAAQREKQDAGDASEEEIEYTDAWNEHHKMKISKSVRKNTFDPDKFARDENDEQRMTYLDDDFEVLQGIDVSEHQGYINWEEVKDAGYDFVFVRVGYRGYGDDGNLKEDEKAVEYMQDAKKAGMDVGAFFFSQAISEEEAAEEAKLSAEVIKKSGVTLDLPLVYDPELVQGVAGRANDITMEQVSKNTDAFRDAAEKAINCKVAIYSNLYWESNLFDQETLNDYEIWYADYVEVPQTPYHFTWWQYSERGTVPGIEGMMDLNLWIRRME